MKTKLLLVIATLVLAGICQAQTQTLQHVPGKADSAATGLVLIDSATTEKFWAAYYGTSRLDGPTRTVKKRRVGRPCGYYTIYRKTLRWHRRPGRPCGHSQEVIDRRRQKRLLVGEKIERAHAQSPAPKPELVVPPPAMQSELTAAFQSEEKARVAYQATSALLREVLWKAMAESGIKPSECAIGSNPFACVRQDPKTGIAFERIPKPESASVKPKEPK